MKPPGQRFDSDNLGFRFRTSVNGETVLILVVGGVISFALILAFIFARLRRKTTEQAREAQKRLRQYEQRLRQASYGRATVLEVYNSAAIGLSEVKVDLRLEVQAPNGTSYISDTSWLVELAWLTQVQPGSTLQVRIDQNDPLQIYPGADWAKLWLWN